MLIVKVLSVNFNNSVLAIACPGICLAVLEEEILKGESKARGSWLTVTNKVFEGKKP